MRIQLTRLALAGAAWAALSAGSAAAEPQSSSGEFVTIGEPVLGIDAAPAAPADASLLPQAAIEGAPRASAIDPLTGEHPVYRLRPEPFSDSGAAIVTLDELLALAVGHNLGLRGQDLLVEKNHYAVDQTYYAFDPTIAAALSYSRRNIGGAAAAQQGGVTSSEGLSASFDYTLPRLYGDSFSFGYNVDRSRFSINNTGGGEFESPTTFGSGLSLGYNRPLLQGAGESLGLIPRHVASNNLQLSYFTLDDRVRTLKKQVLDAYFLSIAARQAISVREASLEVALRQLEREVERYKAGLAIQAAVLQAENNVLTQRAALLSARDAYDTLLDSLTTLVGLPQEFALAVDPEAALLGLDPDELPEDLPQDLWDLVTANSIELKSLTTQLANLRLQREQLTNNLKPRLDLNLSYGRTGEDEGLGTAVTSLDNESYQIGLNWQSTPGQRAAKADVAVNELDLASIELELQDTELQLKARLRELQRDLSIRAEQIGLAESNVVVTRETLNIVLERAGVGLATTLEVIEAQEDLLAAELALLQAQVDYQQAYREILLLAGLI